MPTFNWRQLSIVMQLYLHSYQSQTVICSVCRRAEQIECGLNHSFLTDWNRFLVFVFQSKDLFSVMLRVAWRMLNEEGEAAMCCKASMSTSSCWWKFPIHMAQTLSPHSFMKNLVRRLMHLQILIFRSLMLPAIDLFHLHHNKCW